MCTRYRFASGAGCSIAFFLVFFFFTSDPFFSADFFAIDVMEGRLRVFMNYGTGTAVASPALKISDNHKHHVDITWDPEVRRCHCC